MRKPVPYNQALTFAKHFENEMLPHTTLWVADLILLDSLKWGVRGNQRLIVPIVLDIHSHVRKNIFKIAIEELTHKGDGENI